MSKIKISIQTQFTLVFIIFIAGIVFLTLSSSQRQSKEAIRDELSKMAAIMASQIDGDKMEVLKPGQENTKNYKDIQGKLLQLEKSHPEIKYTYTFKKHDDKLVEYLVDAEWGTKDAVKIGDVYKETSKGMYEGLKEPSADEEIVKDEWGSFLSGYAPVRNGKGQIIGAVGVDMTVDTVAKKQKEMESPMLIALGVIILFAALIIIYISESMIRDIKKLTAMANDISKGKPHEEVQIKRNDEIGDLADSFSRMAASLKILMMGDDDDGGKK